MLSLSARLSTARGHALLASLPRARARATNFAARMHPRRPPPPSAAVRSRGICPTPSATGRWGPTTGCARCSSTRTRRRASGGSAGSTGGAARSTIRRASSRSRSARWATRGLRTSRASSSTSTRRSSRSSTRTVRALSLAGTTPGRRSQHNAGSPLPTPLPLPLELRRGWSGAERVTAAAVERARRRPLVCPRVGRARSPHDDNLRAPSSPLTERPTDRRRRRFLVPTISSSIVESWVNHRHDRTQARDCSTGSSCSRRCARRGCLSARPTSSRCSSARSSLRSVMMSQECRACRAWRRVTTQSNQTTTRPHHRQPEPPRVDPRIPQPPPRDEAPAHDESGG